MGIRIPYTLWHIGGITIPEEEQVNFIYQMTNQVSYITGHNMYSDKGK